MSGPKLADLALLGTSRLTGEIPLPEPLRPLAATLPDELDSGRRLLLLAGLDAVYRAAGYSPAPHRLDIPPEDERPAPTPRAEEVLAEFLVNGHRPLLLLALEHLDRAGFRWPAALLPPLLEQGRSAFRGRLELLARLLDRRGAWLASQHPEWAWASSGGGGTDSDTTSTAWQEGNLETRVRAFANLRKLDPAGAREALAAVFKQDKAEARAALLACLREGLGLADEAFLESCLKDRSQLVREVAKELLLLLPESAWARRCRERVFALLRRDAPAAGGLLGGLKKMLGGAPAAPVVAHLPEDADKSWEDDGIVLKAPQGTGAKAFWLAQLVATVSPRLLAEHLRLEPAELVETFARHEWSEPLLVGLARSTAVVADRELAALVLPVFASPPAKVTPSFYENARELCPRLFLCLSEEQRLGLSTQWLEKGVPYGIEIREGLLPATFSPEAARSFLESLHRAIQVFGSKNEWQIPFGPFLPLAAMALPLDGGPGLELPFFEGNDRANYLYEPARKKFQEILHLRQRLEQEIPL